MPSCSSSTCLTVSTTGTPGTTAPWPDSTAAITRSTTTAGTSGRAASCTSTTVPGPNPNAPRRASPLATDCWRVAPPATTSTGTPPATALTAASMQAVPLRAVR